MFNFILGGLTVVLLFYGNKGLRYWKRAKRFPFCLHVWGVPYFWESPIRTWKSRQCHFCGREKNRTHSWKVVPGPW